MKKKQIILIVLQVLIGFVSYEQKTISEGTITYDIFIQSKSNGSNTKSPLNGAKTTIYLKGNFSRTEMSSTLGTETTIHNANNGATVILKEYSGQKLMITLTKENWQEMNSKYTGVVFEMASETKVIDGYNCKRSIAKLANGSSISVYYTPDLIAINTEYNQAFKNLQGFPLEYEFETNKLTLKYQVSNIDLSPLSVSKFDPPKSGYRVMTYDENKKGKVDGL